LFGHRLAHNEKVQSAIREEPPACLDQAVQLAARNPNTRLVINYLGLPQPHEPPPPAEPFAELSKLLALAVHNNVAVKISGACKLSHEPFLYRDIWDPLFRIFDPFGFERCGGAPAAPPDDRDSDISKWQKE
jgi:predicted TIM-barrel fold metal-dependent hydrolase